MGNTILFVAKMTFKGRTTVTFFSADKFSYTALTVAVVLYLPKIVRLVVSYSKSDTILYLSA